MKEGEYLDSLIHEYHALVSSAVNVNGGYEKAAILKELVGSADWSTSAAYEILRLVENYGAFMLRNALAIAVVLDKEDGSLGF
jgi:hypothetical protein